MSFKLHLIRYNFPDISYLCETQENNFQFLNMYLKICKPLVVYSVISLLPDVTSKPNKANCTSCSWSHVCKLSRYYMIIISAIVQAHLSFRFYM